jgi:hypothetical protein
LVQFLGIACGSLPPNSRFNADSIAQCGRVLPGDDAQAMAQRAHGGGISVDGSVRIAAADRAGRERLPQYCARPPFALERLRAVDPERLLDAGTQPGPGGNGPLRPTPLELIDTASPLWRHHGASTAALLRRAGSERPLTRISRGELERRELAGCRGRPAPRDRPQTLHCCRSALRAD